MWTTSGGRTGTSGRLARMRPRLRVAPSELGDMPLFSTAQGEERGISRRDLTTMVRRELLWRPARGWYSSRMDADEEERHVLRALAVLKLRGDGAVACRTTAALLHGLPLVRTDLSVVEIAKADAGHGRMTKGVRLSELMAGVECVDVIDPVIGTTVRVVDPATAIVGTAMTSHRLAALAAGDAALHKGVCTTAQLESAIDRGRRGTGIESARQTMRHLDARHESPGETLTAAVLRAGPWAFDPQVSVRAQGKNYRLDFALREYKVAIEFDGEIKYTGPEVMEAQLAREADLIAEGWVFVRVGWADVDDEAALLARVGDKVAVACAAA